MTQKLFYFFYAIKYDLPYTTNEWLRKMSNSGEPDGFWNALNFGWWQMQISDDY
jgi:hypothetical protein